MPIQDWLSFIIFVVSINLRLLNHHMPKNILTLFVFSLIGFVILNACKKTEAIPTNQPLPYLSSIVLKDSAFQSLGTVEIETNITNSNLISNGEVSQMTRVYISKDTIISDDDLSYSSTGTVYGSSSGISFSLPKVSSDTIRYIIASSYLYTDYVQKDPIKKIFKINIIGSTINLKTTSVIPDTIYTDVAIDYDMQFTNNKDYNGSLQFSYYFSTDSIISSDDIQQSNYNSTNINKASSQFSSTIPVSYIQRDQWYYIIIKPKYTANYNYNGIVLKNIVLKKYLANNFTISNFKINKADSLSAGDSVYVSIDVTCPNGKSSIDHKLYLSTDSTLDYYSTKYYLGTATFASGQKNASMSLKGLIPALDATKTYYLVIETHENYASTPYQYLNKSIKLLPRKNFITYLGVIVPFDEVSVNEYVGIKEQLNYNNPKASTSAYVSKYYLSLNDTILDANDLSLTDYPSTAAIASGNNSLNVNLDFGPWNKTIPPGTYNLLVTFYENDYTETTQKKFIKTIVINDGLPKYNSIDLRNTSFNKLTDSTLTFDWTLDNNNRTIKSVNQTIYLSTDETISSNDIIIYATAPTVITGSNAGVSSLDLLNQAIPSNDYYVLIQTNGYSSKGNFKSNNKVTIY